MTLVPVDGISISARSNADFDDINFNISFNFGKQSVYSPGSYTELNKEYNGGIGFYTNSQKQKSIFNKKGKDTKKLIRMKLSGLFIEEKPVDAFWIDNFCPDSKLYTTLCSAP